MALDLIYTFVSSPGCSKEKKRNIIYCKTPNSASHNFCFFIVEASLSLCACFLIPPSLPPPTSHQPHFSWMPVRIYWCTVRVA